MTLALLARQAPSPVRGAFLAGLRAQGVAEPSDPVAPGLPRAWSRPDLYSAVFAATVLPVLGEPERVAAAEAIATLDRGRGSRPRPEAEAGHHDH